MAGAQTQTFTYFVGRESVQVTALPGMASWREHLYALMERNATDPAFYFRLPTHQVFELGIIVELWPPMPGLPREASTTSCPTLITPFDRTQARQWVSHILQRSLVAQQVILDRSCELGCVRTSESILWVS